MSRVLTNEQNYYDIADTIRQMKNVNTTYKPREMASALKDIYSNEVEGVPPLSFEANGNNLLNYRIDGASGGVGDRTKNLLQNTATSQTINGVTFTVNNDGSVTCNGTPNSGIYSDLLLSGTLYGEKLIIEYGNYILSSIGSSSALVAIIGNGTHEIGRARGNDVTFTDDVSWVLLRCYGVEEPQTVYPMIRLASIEDNTYEPYGYKVPVVVNGKNLLNNVLTSRTLNGVTITVNQDKSINISGQLDVSYKDFYVSGRWNSDVPLFEEGTYKLIVESTNNNIPITCGFNGSYATGITGTGNRVFTNQISSIMFRLTDSMTLNNETLKIMVCKPIIEDTSYEPYHETTTNIYLEEPICNVNNNIDYIDFSSQSKMKKTGTIEFVNSSNWLLEGEHNFYYDMIIETASPKSLVVSNKVPSLATSMAETIANQYTENVWISAGQRVNLWLADIDHTLTALQNWLSQEPLIVQYQLQNHSEISVNLPAIPTLDGTNTLSIDTTVQPSNVYIQAPKDSIEATQIANRLEEI